jgi:hypothetical protein
MFYPRQNLSSTVNLANQLNLEGISDYLTADFDFDGQNLVNLKESINSKFPLNEDTGIDPNLSQTIIDTYGIWLTYSILSDEKLKEFFYDLIINEDMANYKIGQDSNNQMLNPKDRRIIRIKSDWSESDNESTCIPNSSHACMITKLTKHRLNSSGVQRRRFGQQLCPIFIKGSRAITANTELIKKREEKRLSESELKPLKVINDKSQEIGIKSQEYNLETFKANIDHLHRKTLTSKFADTQKANNIFKGTKEMYRKSRPKKVSCTFRNGRLCVFRNFKLGCN